MHEHPLHRQQGRSLIISILLNVLITIVQVIGGIISNSLSLISDALHNLTDSTALFIAWLAGRYSRKSADLSQTFGYKRAEILAAFINAIVLVAVSIYLFYEAWQRFINPEEVRSKIMLLVATIGLIANLVAVLLLHRHSQENINIRAAYLHLFADTLSSVAVIIGGVLMWIYQWYWVDPLVTVLVGLYIIKEAYGILRESGGILMQSAPRGIDITDIRESLRKIEGVSDIHHVHLWRLTDRNIHFESHVSLSRDMLLSQSATVRDQINVLLAERFNINHVTIQLEFEGCDEGDLIMKRDSETYHTHHHKREQ